MVEPTAAAEKLKVFISYARSDKAFADRLVAALEARDFEVLIDRRDLPYGEKWLPELAEFVRNADVVVFIVSPQAAASQWCRWEIELGRAEGKRLVPVEIIAAAPAALPAAVAEINILSFVEEADFEQRADALARALRTDRAWLKELTRLTALARYWVACNNDTNLRLQGVSLWNASQWLGNTPKDAPPVPAALLKLIQESRDHENYQGGWYNTRPADGNPRAMEIEFTCKRCGFFGEFTPAVRERPPEACPRCGLGRPLARR